MNPDAQIVRYNVAADEKGVGSGLDVGYLQGLSADAVPAMAVLDTPLQRCLLASVAVQEPTSFAGWNLGRDRAAELVGGSQGGRGTGDDFGACAEVYLTP